MGDKRIDRITFYLDTWDERGLGRQEIVFHVDAPDPDGPLVLAVRNAWQAWYDGMVRMADDGSVGGIT